MLCIVSSACSSAFAGFAFLAAVEVLTSQASSPVEDDAIVKLNIMTHHPFQETMPGSKVRHRLRFNICSCRYKGYKRIAL